ncbi:cytosolic sulfotransferase 5-like [Miscanthus floridulus]
MPKHQPLSHKTTPNGLLIIGTAGWRHTQSVSGSGWGPALCIMNRGEEQQQLDLEDILGTMSTAAPPAAVPAAAGEEVATAPASSEATAAPSTRKHRNPSLYANVPAAEIIDSLPLETRLMVRRRQYGGFWQAEFLLKGMAAAGTCFEPEASDIFLASLPKSGTTWLKALAFATLNRATHSPSDGQHPLNHRNPHDCVGFLEFMIIQQQQQHDDAGATGLYEALPSSPRLFATHLPYSQLPHAITEEGSRCRIVYVCRDPKDVLISYWNFYKKVAATADATASGDGDGQDSAGVTKFEEAFELFCEGRFPGGPHWLHALEYWHASQRRPDQVLFLRYEDMLGDPVGNLKKLAAFMGCTFSEEDEEDGVVDQIVELCSLENLKSKDVNKNGSTRLGIKSESFFRKGQVGDWKNYMTMDMAARLDKIVEEATRGSGLTFGDSSLLGRG